MSISHIDFIRPEFLNDSSIRSWFSLKNPDFGKDSNQIPGMNIGLNSEEDSEVIRVNFESLCLAIETRKEQVAMARQVHSADVLQVNKGGLYQDTDAFVTTTPGLALLIQVADCGAVLLGDPKNKVIGAAHAGWRGAVAEIVPKTIQRMLELGAEVGEIKVFVSPCLGVHNFEVGEEVAAHFGEHLVERSGYAKPHVDLKGLIHDQLISEGIPKANIDIDERCTIDDEKLFYSYRREGKRSGRMAGIIKLNI